MVVAKAIAYHAFVASPVGGPVRKGAIEVDFDDHIAQIKQKRVDAVAHHGGANLLLRGDLTEDVRRALMALASRLLVPAPRRGFVSRNATSGPINLGESHLRLGHSLFRGHTEKLERFGGIGLASLTLGNHYG